MFQSQQTENYSESSGIGKVLFGIAAFGILHKASSSALKASSAFIARGARRLIRQFAGPEVKAGFRGLQSRALADARQHASRMGLGPVRRSDLTMGQLFKPWIADTVGLLSSRSTMLSSGLNAGNKMYRQLKFERTQYFRKAGLRGQDLHKAIAGEFHPGDIDMRRNLVSRYIKADGGFSKRFMGSALQWSYKYARSVPGLYVADRALNLFNQESREPAPKWYDIPGHIGGMIKFGVTMAPMDLAFRGATAGFRVGRDATAEASRRYLSARPGVREKVRNALSQDGMLGDLRAYTKAFGRAYTEKRREGWGISIQPLRFNPSPYNLKDLVKKTIQYRKEIGKSTFGVEAKMKQVLDTIDAVKKNPNVDPELFSSIAEQGRSNPISQAFDRALSVHTRAPKKTLLQHIFRDKPKSEMSFQMIENYGEKAGWSRNEVDDVKKMLGNKKMYFGTNTLESGDFRLWTGAYWAEKGMEALGRMKVPIINWSPFQRVAMQKKMGAFEVIDDQRAILMGSDKGGMDRVARAKQGEVFFRVDDSLFVVSPSNIIDPIRPFGPPAYKGRGKMVYLTSSEASSLASSESPNENYAHSTGWFTRAKRKFEIGGDRIFFGNALSRWVNKDRSPYAPGVVLRGDNEYTRLIRGMENVTSDNASRFKEYTDVVLTHLSQADETAFDLLNRNRGLRNRILNILGVPEARREVFDEGSEALLKELNHMIPTVVGPIRNTYDDGISAKLNRALSMFHSLQNPEYVWNSRASVVGLSSKLTTGDALRGEYFRKLMVRTRMEKGGDFEELGTYRVLKKIFKTVDEEQLSLKERTALKAFFTGNSMELSISKHLPTKEGLRPGAEFDKLRKIVMDHSSSLQDVFEQRIVGKQIFSTTAHQNERLTYNFLNSNQIENKIWLFSKGNKNPVPGLIDQFMGRSSWENNTISGSSLAFNRWIIRPFNRTLATVGLDLTYNSNAEFVRKFAMYRGLGLWGAIYGYKGLDAAVSAFPGFNNTILDDGTTVAAADIIAKTNLMRAGLFDVLGVTDAAKHLEGLMPGSVESPAAKILRAAAPPVLGRFIAGKAGFFAGLGVSAASGFGLPNLTRTKEELEEVYSGRELVPVRKGRYWELCVHKDALIRTNKGPKKAKDVIVGDVVYNAAGEAVTVDDKSCRDMESTERMFAIYTHVFGDDPIMCTGNHELLIQREEIDMWVPADSLMTTDKLLLPLRIFDGNIVEDTTWTRENLFGMGYLVGNFIANGEIVFETIVGDELAISERKMNMHFSRYVGNAIESVNWIHDLFEHEAVISITEANEYIVTSTDKKMMDNFKVISTKHIPESFYHLGIDFQKGFVYSLIKNASDMDMYGNLHFILTREDKSFPLYVIDLLLTFDIVSKHSTKTLNLETGPTILDHIVVSKKEYKKLAKVVKNLGYRIPRKENNKQDIKATIENNCLIHPISKIKQLPYDGEVYDFWVKSGNSFCGIAGVYHNSKGPFEGGRITSWVPSWYTRLKSQYRYTDAALGTKMESLLYSGPLAAVGITDPYHYERCVVKDSMVLTDQGFRPVQDLQIEDMVYTHEGTKRRILNKWEKKIDEDVISLYSIGLPTSTTAEHRYYVRAGEKISWIRADNLREGDYTLIPRLQFRNTHMFDLLEYFPNDHFTYEFIKRREEVCQRYIKLDRRLGYVFGLYLYGFQLSDHPLDMKCKDQSVNVARMASALSACFGRDGDAILHSWWFREILNRFGVTGSLQIPKEFYMCNRDFTQGLLDGLFYQEHKKGTWGTNDKKFVTDICRLILMFDIYADVQQSATLGFKFPKEQWKNFLALKNDRTYVPVSTKDVVFGDVFIELRIKRIDTERYVGKIYDLEIDGAHSFHGDCCVYHNTRYNERPYPLTAPPFINVPVLGPMLNMTIGKVVKPQFNMHEDELSIANLGQVGDGYASILDRPQTYEGGMGTKQTRRTMSLGYQASESMYRMTEAIGLRGFMAQTLMEQEGPGTYNPTLEDASSITSHSKQFWDMQVGGLLGLSEGVRRLYPRSRNMNTVNPIRNTQPNWVPEDLQFGDAIGRLDNGLLLLPSRAYEASHSIKHTFPLAIDYLGYDPREAALLYTKQEKGDLVEVHHNGVVKRLMQADLSRRNMLTSRDIPIFDPINQIDGHIDAMVRLGDGDIPMQIKASTAEQLSGMSRPYPAHLSQLNFMLRMMKKRMGQITYVAADNPELKKTFTIQYNEQRYKRDLIAVNQTREMAMDMIRSGVGYSGESYSYSDRLIVLSSVAPWSDEYKETLKKLKTLQKFNLLDDDDIGKVNRAERMRKAVMRQYDVYPRRFQRGKLMTPDSEYNLMSENTNIKAASEYSLFERAIGSVWESFATTRIPFISRFYGMNTPEKMYDEAVLMGTSSMWSHPVRDFVVPASTSFMLSDDPGEGARKGAFAGAMFGPPGLAVGAILGGIYGSVSNGQYIPGRVQKRRELDEYFSAIKFVKGMNLYNSTGDPNYLQMAKETPFGLSSSSTPSELYRAIPYKERAFLMTFSSVEDPGERRKILQKVSPTMGSVLQFMWSQKKSGVGFDVEDYTSRNSLPPGDWTGWSADAAVEDIQMVTVQNEGMNAHDFGLGWSDQKNRIHNSHVPIGSLDVSDVGNSDTGVLDNSDDIRTAVTRIIESHGLGYPTVVVTPDASKRVYVNLRTS